MVSVFKIKGYVCNTSCDKKWQDFVHRYSFVLYSQPSFGKFNYSNHYSIKSIIYYKAICCLVMSKLTANTWHLEIPSFDTVALLVNLL